MKLSKNTPFKILIILICIFLCLFVATIFAHPGNTDSKGGHYNRSTGEYHYHHGKPEHQHKNGECPYETNQGYYRSHNDSGSMSALLFIGGIFCLPFIGYKSKELLNDLFTTTFRMDKESSKIIAYILSIIISIISLIILIKVLSFF